MESQTTPWRKASLSGDNIDDCVEIAVFETRD
jgi:hypothetical protein